MKKASGGIKSEDNFRHNIYSQMQKGKRKKSYSILNIVCSLW